MSQPQDYPYATHLDIKFPALRVVDVPALVKACTDKWYNQTLCQVNDSVVRLGVVQGEYHWHKHDNDDEFFFVLRGTLSSISRIARSICSPSRDLSFPKASRTAPAPLIEQSFLWWKPPPSFLPVMRSGRRGGELFVLSYLLF